jgi:hypothetical protein
MPAVISEYDALFPSSALTYGSSDSVVHCSPAKSKTSFTLQDFATLVQRISFHDINQSIAFLHEMIRNNNYLQHLLRDLWLRCTALEFTRFEATT